MKLFKEVKVPPSHPRGLGAWKHEEASDLDVMEAAKEIVFRISPLPKNIDELVAQSIKGRPLNEALAFAASREINRAMETTAGSKHEGWGNTQFITIFDRIIEHYPLGMTEDNFTERLEFVRDCSCHLSPPCDNCIDHSRLFPEEY